MKHRFRAATPIVTSLSLFAVGPASATQVEGPAPATTPMCAAGRASPTLADREVIRQVVEGLEGEAERAAASGEHQRAASLYLQAERHLPMCAAAARAERIRRALAMLRAVAHAESVGRAALLGAAIAMLESFLLDMNTQLGTQAAGEIEEITALKGELGELRRELESARASEGAEEPQTLAEPPVCPVCAATPTPSPMPAERAAYARRTRGLAAGVGVSAGLMLVAAGAGLGLRLRVVEGGDLNRRIQDAAAASTDDGNPNNDVPHGKEHDICQAASAIGAAADGTVRDLCAEHRRTLYASTAMWVTSGAFVVTTAVFAVLLAQHRRHPLARELTRREAGLSGRWLPGGALVGVGWKF